MKKTISVYIPHYGCPHNCVFCDQTKITGVRSIPSAGDIRAQLINDYKTVPMDYTVEVAFFGGSFTALDMVVQEEALKTARSFLDSIPNKSALKASTRPDAIDEERLTLLKKYGVDTIELGVQSMDDEVLTASGRGHDSASVYKASELIKKYGFTLGHQIMIGLPKDSHDKLKSTVSKIISINPDIARIYPVLVIKGTPLETMYLKGKYKPLDVNEAVRLSLDVYKAMNLNGISVIRIGLQNTPLINTDADVTTGPYHPAFGELVLSEYFKDFILSKLPGIKPAGSLEIRVNNNNLSKVSGHKKSNKIYFQKNCNLTLKISAEPALGDEEIIIGSDKYLMSKGD